MNPKFKNVDDFRGSTGRFLKGNPGGPGNPHAERAAHWRRLIADCVSDDDLAAVIEALVSSAKSGKLPAIVELLNRLIGRPVEADLLQRLEELEQAADARDAA